MPLGSAALALVKAVGLLGVLASRAQDALPIRHFGIFHVALTEPATITLSGEIDLDAMPDFRRAVAAAPGARLLLLDSIGGLVRPALAVAEEVHRRRMATVVTADAGCYSACAMIYFAGVERVALGELGVHQASAPGGAGFINAVVAGVMRGYGVPPPVVVLMETTRPEDMHVFSRCELNRYGLQHAGPTLGRTMSRWKPSG